MRGAKRGSGTRGRLASLHELALPALLLTLGPLLAAPLAVAGAGTGAGAAASRGEGAAESIALRASHRPSREDFSQIWRELETLRLEQLLQRADQLWETDPEPTLRAMVLRVGRQVPPTLTAVRRGERLAIREGAARWLRSTIDSGPAARELWEDEVRDILADSSQVIQWCATARALGRLGEYGFAGDLAQRLDSKNPRLVLAVREALHDLYLRWFEDAEAFARFAPGAQESCPDGVFMETARQLDHAARQSRIELLAYEPQRATALLADPDPRLRAAAAAALGRAHNGDVEAAAESLLTHAAVERDGAAFQATLEALLQARGAAAANSPAVARLRGVLEARVEEGDPDLQAPLAEALRRLPWTEVEGGDSSLMHGVELLVDQLTELSAPHRLTDRDVLVTSMFALESLAARARAAGLPIRRTLEPTNAMVIAMIEDARESDVVRIAAAKLLPLVGDADSIGRAANVLGAARTSAELRYNLLAALGDLAAELPPDDPAAGLVLATLLDRLKGDDANLRRRALSYLSAPKLRPLVERADPAPFFASLGRETVPELQAQLLDLVAALGGPADVERLIALPNFDAIARSGPAGVSSLAEALTTLAGEDGSLEVRGAARLLAVADSASRIQRLRAALGMAADLGEPTLAGLAPEQHLAIVRWAADLRAAAGALPGGQAFLGRLNRVHLAACRAAANGELGGELAHVQALLLSDWIALDPEAGEASEVLEHFAAALDHAGASGDPEERARVLRDRARFLVARGEDGAALEDYRALFEAQLPARPVEAGSSAVEGSALELRDLRAGSELLARSVDDSDASGGAAREALRVSLVLVQEPNWKLEPMAVRSQDLRDLAERALRVAEPASLERAARIFADLPALPDPPAEGQPPAEPPVAPAGALWAGLVDTREKHAALLELRRRLGEGLAQARTQEADAPQEPPPAEPPGGGEDG